MKAERLHIIVHPGFIAESEDQQLQRGKPIIGAAQAMSEHYADRISSMLPEEIAIGMLHVHPDEVGQLPHDSLFRRLIDDFRERLGNRFIITDQSQSVTDHSWISAQLSLAMRTAKSRNIIISSSTPTIAYGETLFYCVPNCAERINTLGKFDGKTIIDARHCDVDIPGGVDAFAAEREFSRFHQIFPHTVFTMDPQESYFKPLA